MERERKPFQFEVGDETYIAELGKCACVLFRNLGEVDYFALDIDDDNVLRVFNSVDIVRWIAGYRLEQRDGNFYRVPTRAGEDRSTFREQHGWNPSVIEKEEPSERELDMWIELNTADLDGERP